MANLGNSRTCHFFWVSSSGGVSLTSLHLETLKCSLGSHWGMGWNKAQNLRLIYSTEFSLQIYAYSCITWWQEGSYVALVLVRVYHKKGQPLMNSNVLQHFEWASPITPYQTYFCLYLIMHLCAEFYNQLLLKASSMIVCGTCMPSECLMSSYETH